MSTEEPDNAAPPGVTCAEHRERTATFKCPRCGKHACITCFHVPVNRCVWCLRTDPAEASPPMPFEAGDGTLLGRYFRTFGTAFYPARSAPAFARPDVTPALKFFLLSALPLVLLAGIVPYTRTLMFGNLRVELLGNPTQSEIVLDVLRAIAAQTALSGVELACLFLPFVSLVAAYAPDRKNAAVRVVLYRFWLGPAAACLGYLAAWLMPMPVAEVLANPEQMPPATLLVVGFAQAALRVFQILALTSTARIACGLSIPLSLVVVGVPLILQILAVPMASHGIERTLPKAPAAALEAEARGSSRASEARGSSRASEARASEARGSALNADTRVE